LSVVEDQKVTEEQNRQLNAELEQRVRNRTAQLETANREMEAFSYSVSHDLRAPLRTLEGFSAILLTDYHDSLDAQGQHYLTRIQEAAQRMAQLIEDMLNLSRIGRRPMNRSRIDLSAVTRQIIDEMKTQLSDRVVEFEIQPDLVIQADDHLMKIVMQNLLGNAVKFTTRQKQAHIQVGMLVINGIRTYFVRDNGAGFDMAYVDKLFSPFQRLHKSSEYPGTGIGLTIVQRIIARHGGRVWPEAAIDQGATFYFTLGD
jgi:light-regulated signal transduction histidine kinase (bacteriophytochrome)